MILDPLSLALRDRRGGPELDYMAHGIVDLGHKSRAYHVSRIIQLHSFFLCFYNSLHSHGIVTKHLFPDFTCSRPLLVFEMVKQVELSIHCIVKGNHECLSKVNIGEIFYAFKKRGERENTFKVTNDQGQLGHL